MKNFIFISPNFPLTYWRFCKELKNNGLRVLGIGDCPYNELTQEQRNSMHEYYKVSSLENPLDRGAWWTTVHRVAKSWEGLT